MAALCFAIVEGTEKADIDKALTAELVGDYLLTDYDFIKQISVENRNVFQRLWDEVKYLCKIASAGSKEAREFERVKRSFEKAYKEAMAEKSTADEGGVRYSLNIQYSNGTVEELSDARNVTDEQILSYLAKAKASKLKGHSYIPVRKDTPQVIIDTLKQVGENVDNLSLVMSVNKARQAMSNKDKSRNLKNKSDNVRGHSLKPEEILEIIKGLDEPSLMIYQTERYDKNGKELPNNVAVFVEFNNGEKEGMAVVEFDSEFDNDAIGNEYGDTNYHTVVTVFEPDRIRDGVEFDYAQELLENPNNIELEIRRRQPNESATGEKHPNTFEDTPSSIDSIPNSTENVKKRDIFGFEINENADVDEDLLEELSIYHPEAEVDGEGNVTVYHRTSKANAEKIRKTGVMTALEDALFFFSKSEGYASDYGDTALKFKIPSTVLRVNDIFDGEVHFDVPLKRMNNQWSMNVSKYLVDENANTSDSFSLSDKSKNTGNIVAPMRHEITGKDFRVKGADGTTQNTPIAEQQELAPVGHVPIETKKQKLKAKAEAYQTEVDKNIQLRNETAAYYDEKISTADALAGVFSSEQGINEFVDWLQKESGYAQAQKKTILEKLSEWLLEIIDKIRELVAEGHLNDVSKEFANAQAEQFADVRQKFLQVLDEIEGVEGAEGVKRSFQGYAEDGKGKYKGNFPKGTPKLAKSEKILKYIKNVWSKKPIKLVIKEGENTKTIYAQFDPYYDESGNTLTDASKLMGGNRHGTSAEQRVTLDLADDYYQIASESEYNYSKDETGKTNPAHKDVVKWHYFINDIYFAEYDSEEYIPYRVSINVKERADGDFVYSFSAEKQKRLITQRTLHAVVNDDENIANNQSSNNSIPNSSKDVKSSRKFSLDWIDFAEEQQRERSAVSELTELKKINEELRAQIRHPGVKHIVSQLGVQKVARHLKSEYMSKINIHKLAGELGDFYTLIANGDGISWDSLQIHIERIADMILGESKYKKPDISDYAKDVLRDIRSVKIKLNDEQKSEVASEYGSYNEFRKRTKRQAKRRSQTASFFI